VINDFIVENAPDDLDVLARFAVDVPSHIGFHGQEVPGLLVYNGDDESVSLT